MAAPRALFLNGFFFKTFVPGKVFFKELSLEAFVKLSNFILTIGDSYNIVKQGQQRQADNNK